MASSNKVNQSGDKSRAIIAGRNDHIFVPLSLDDDKEEDMELDFESLQPKRRSCFWNCLRWTAYLVFFLVCITVLFAALLFGVPILLEKVIVPLMGWEALHVNKPMLAIISILSLSFLPVFLLPTGPSMWLTGIIFGYLWGFLLILIGASIGCTIPYFVGRWLLQKRVQDWLANQPKKAAILHLAEHGGFFHQFRVVILLRLSPFPYAALNYAISATKIEYGPYITASMLTLVPDALLTIYCGRLVKTLADYHQAKRRRLTPLEMGSQGLGLCMAVVVVVLGMIYGRKALKELEDREANQEDSELMDMTGQRAPPIRGEVFWNGGSYGNGTQLVDKTQLTQFYLRRLDHFTNDELDSAWKSPRSVENVTTFFAVDQNPVASGLLPRGSGSLGQVEDYSILAGGAR